MEDGMIERVAKAMADKARYFKISVQPGEAEDIARTAIGAMREPTEAMERAGWAELHNVQSQHDSPGGCYRAMIDAALEPAKQPA